MRWLAQHRWGFGFIGSTGNAFVSTAFAGESVGSAPAASVQCSMSSHTAMRSGSVASVCLNPQVAVPQLSGTVQRVRSLRHVSATLPYYSPGRTPSATAPSANVGTLPSAQTGHNDVTVNLGSRPSVTPGSVDAGTVGQVNAPKITINDQRAPTHREGHRLSRCLSIRDGDGGEGSSLPRTISPAKSGLRPQCSPRFLAGDEGAARVVGEDECLHAGTCRCLGCLLDARVVVEDVLQPLVGDGLDQVGADHCLDVEVGAGAQPVETRAGHGVAGQRRNRAGVLDSVADGRCHRTVIGLVHGDMRIGDVELVAGADFGDLDGRSVVSRSAW